MEREAKIKLCDLKVDGGASKNDFLMEFQSDILNCNIYRPLINETTALGACYLAGIGIGLWDKETIKNKWILDKKFVPEMSEVRRNELYYNWQRALKACVAFADKKNY